jgi:hypothetical protein
MRLPPETIEHLLKANWSAYAAFAYRQYLTEGRGLLLLLLSQLNPGQIALNYLALGSKRLHTWGELPPPVAQIVATYKPETEVVLAVLFPDKRVVYSLMDTSDGVGVSPKEAYAQGAAPAQRAGRN